jgi:hypothetical protein
MHDHAQLRAIHAFLHVTKEEQRAARNAALQENDFNLLRNE